MNKMNVDQLLRRARRHERSGELDQARQIYTSILDDFPGNGRARKALQDLAPATMPPATALHPSKEEADALLAHYNAGNPAAMIKAGTALLQRYPKSFVLWNMLGAGYRRLGRLSMAEDAFGTAIRINPSFVDGLINMGLTLIDQGKFTDAIGIYQRLIALRPDHMAGYNNLGLAQREAGRCDDAVQTLEKALEIWPDYAEALNNLGLTFHQLGRPEEALKAYERAIALRPAHAATQYNMGNTLKQTGRLAEAAVAFRRAIVLDPGHVDAFNNLGNTLTAQGKLAEAAETFHHAITFRPDNALLHNNLGNVWLEKKDFDQACQAYRQAIALRPDYAEAHNNLGVALNDAGRLEEAVTAYETALSCRPDFPEALANLGTTLRALGRLDEAIAAYRSAVALKPDHADARCALLHQMQHICDWSAHDQLAQEVEQLGITTDAVTPFSVLSMEDNPERQKLRSQAWAKRFVVAEALPLRDRPATRPRKLRIGYFSADFHDHPCLFLLMGMLRCHDRARFEICLFSFGLNKAGALRERAVATADRFFDVADMSDDALAAFARSQDLDIAIDLMGYTREARPGLFQFRLAPVQIGFIGFPGTTGADCIDYLVGDPTVIPDDQRQAYTEKVFYVPHTYLPNDNQLPISDRLGTRADFGLPEDAFVFCCFNSNYKLSPREFDIWMRLLGKVENSVLWLLKSNRFSEDNLRRETLARGIDPARVVFAEKAPHDVHLARHRHADIFIDTFNYNAHTTASEALWAGLPVVTKAGRQFAARVAASMLRSVDLPELITQTEADYEALILDLATDPERLRAIRDKLAVNRLSKPLFDTLRNTRAFEDGLRQVYDLYFDGEAPRDIWCRDPQGIGDFV